jgi:hypothetical protein
LQLRVKDQEMHGLGGPPSTRRIAEKVEKRAAELVRREYADVGTNASQRHLQEHHEIAVSRETLRNGYCALGFTSGSMERTALEKTAELFRGVGAMGHQRARLAGGARGPQIYLTAMVDDATSWALAQFAPHDSTDENGWLEHYGRMVKA